jgi:hypothetical protein
VNMILDARSLLSTLGVRLIDFTLTFHADGVNDISGLSIVRLTGTSDSDVRAVSWTIENTGSSAGCLLALATHAPALARHWTTNVQKDPFGG